MKSGVYRISTTINDSVYIGSSIYVKSRFSQHKYTLRNNKSSNRKLQEFYNKHGLGCLVFEVIEHCAVHDLKTKEQHYLDLYKSKFNISKFSCSTKGVKCSEEKKVKISKSLKVANLKGIPKSEETKARMRKPKSKEHTARIKAAQKLVIKTVYQYSLDLGLIEEYESISEAARKTGFRHGDISAVCNLRQKTAKGFIWSFKKL
jgi:group I intron endonuclease